jgi:hypothetical protein
MKPAKKTPSNFFNLYSKDEIKMIIYSKILMIAGERKETEKEMKEK